MVRVAFRKLLKLWLPSRFDRPGLRDTVYGAKLRVEQPAHRSQRLDLDVIRIKGWAWSPGPPTRVSVSTAGHWLGDATLDIKRPDLVGRLGTAAENCGFELIVSAADLLPGLNHIDIRADFGRRLALTTSLDVNIVPWAVERPRRAARRAVTPGPPAGQVRICLVIDATEGTDDDVRRTLASLECQTHATWRARVMGGDLIATGERVQSSAATSFTDALGPDSAETAWCGVLSAGDRLEPDALACLTASAGDADLIYGDEDRHSAAGTYGDPVFKPNASFERLLSGNCVGRPWLVRARCLDGLAPASEHDLFLQLVARGATIAHVPEVLCARPCGAGTLTDATAVERALSPLNASLTTAPGLPPDALDVAIELSERPPVSLIVLTRASSDLVRHCTEALVNTTRYPLLEWIFIENAPAADAAAGSFIASFPQPMRHLDEPFNWARFNNLGAAQATSPILVFVNDDVVPIANRWLEELLVHALRDDVGPVGAKLLYGDNRLQHGGVILSRTLGGPVHVNRGLTSPQSGCRGETDLLRNCAAVTGAVMMVRRDVFDAVGGFDERFHDDFNDIDFCLRARNQGYRTVYAPRALLFHHEGVTRSGLANADDLEAFRHRWQSVIADGDPYLNPSLRDDCEEMVLDIQP